MGNTLENFLDAIDEMARIERRQTGRVQVHWWAKLQTGEGASSALCIDASEGGIKLRLRNDMALGEHVTVHLAAGEAGVVVGLAEVAHFHKPTNTAHVRFLSLEASSGHRLSAHLWQLRSRSTAPVRRPGQRRF